MNEIKPNSADSAQDEREVFEKWIAGTGRAHMLERSKQGWYIDLNVTAWWAGWQARASLANNLQAGEPVDPMDWPLPCDVTVGAGTIKKGCKLSTLVVRMKVLHEMAMKTVPSQQAGKDVEIILKFLDKVAAEQLRILRLDPKESAIQRNYLNVMRVVGEMRKFIDTEAAMQASPAQAEFQGALHSGLGQDCVDYAKHKQAQAEAKQSKGERE